ncbi:MAG: DUF4337 domain-containing protein [Chloroflexota bacterium]
MDPVDAADHIRDAVESERAQHRSEERFRTRVAVAIAFLAMLLAIASLGGQNATKETINANIQASDAFAFYQAKNVRQTANQLAAQELEAALALHADVAARPGAQQSVQVAIDRMKATVARYQSEPDRQHPSDLLKGEGKKELLARARYWEAKRDHAQRQDPNFDYATAMFEIAIVLGSVAIVATSRLMVGLALALGAFATVLTINGFFLVFPLPIGQ